MGRRAIKTIFAVAALAALAAFPRASHAVLENAAAKHNFTDIPGYALGGACPACHKPHAASGEKRLWTSDKNNLNDGLRSLAAAKAASLDQAAGGEYPGIYLCLDCHGGTTSSPSWTTQPGHQAEKIRTHSTREMAAAGYATKYPGFVVQCTTCHDTHDGWTGSFQTGKNGYMVMANIQTPNSGTRAVVFTAMSGPGSMGTNTSPYNAVCEVCHTQTAYHKNTGAPAHNDGKNCTQCHSHSGGFAGIGCNACHGDPPVSYATLVGRSANPGSAPTGATTPGMHAFHTLSTAGGGYQCYVCHAGGMTTSTGSNKIINIGFSAFGVSTSGTFDGFSPISGYTFSARNTTGGTLQCRNTYCHGNFSGGNTGNAPVWNDRATGACGTCHATTTLPDHATHLTAAWGPKASCDDCHPAGSSTGSHSTHVNGKIDFKDGQDLANTTVCDNCHGCTAQTKPTWGDTTRRSLTSWCETCHNGSSVISTAAGTGGVAVRAPNVVGGVGYGYDSTGHGKTGIALDCIVCHSQPSAHIDGISPTYKASLNNYQSGYRLTVANTVPLLTNYTSSAVALCFESGCHVSSRLLGMPPDGKPSARHVHQPIPTDQWYTNFRNMSTVAGLYAGNWDYETGVGGYVNDVPTNIHWNHMDDFGSSKRGPATIYDSDGDGHGDSYVTCKTCHNPHGTRQPAMVMDDFSLKTFSALTNQSLNPTYRWLGSSTYTTTRCTQVCHDSGNSTGTAGTKYYRQPTTNSTVLGVPLGVAAQPLP